ncbi:MAG TPA: metallophosphoesterase [Bacteroidales bacterium]|nr:metallophosphoesterase [Bacteroidales bacterium]
MFHTIITLSYLIPGIYLFARLWQLFIPREYALLYIAIFALIFSVYPLGNSLNERSITGDAIRTLSGWLLPFLLYVFLLVIVLDILLLFNFLLKLQLLNRYIATHKVVCLGGILSVAALIVVAGIINFNTIRITKYEVEIPRKASSVESLRIAFVSDFHLEEKVPPGFVRNFARKVQEARPDILLYGGDIVEGRGENIELFEGILRSIKPAYGTFGVMGNHDRFTNYRDNFFLRSGITLLTDSVVVFKDKFILAGRLDNPGRRADIKELLNKIRQDLPLIIMDHRPVDYDNISETGADIVFSGHTHKGQMFPINLYIRSLYELSYGYLQKRNTHFFVSSGIRLWGPPVRTTGKSEIVILDVVFTK